MMALTIRNLDPDSEYVDNLKELTGQKTASKALLMAGTKALFLHGYARELEERVDKQAVEIQRLESVIEELDGLCARVREITGQGAFKL